MKSKKPTSPPPAPPPSGHPFAAAAHWDLEQSYESRPRSVKKRKTKENTRLPIKTANGIQQAPDLPADNGAPSGSDSDGGDEIGVGSVEGETAEEEEEEEEGKRPPSTVPRKQRLLEAKEELAAISMSIIEDPEENVPTPLFLFQGGANC